MPRKRTIEITVETERIVEIRFRETPSTTADDADAPGTAGVPPACGPEACGPGREDPDTPLLEE